MNWTAMIHKVLGFFWTRVWKDTWLIDMLGDFFRHVVGKPIESRADNLEQQLSYKDIVTSDYIPPIRILLDASSEAPASVLLSEFVIGSSQIGGGTNRYQYNCLNRLSVPDIIYNKVINPDIKLQRGIDFQCFDGVFIFNEKLSDIGFSSNFITWKDKLYVCYELWTQSESYSTLRDSFTGIMQLPDNWLWKYPGAVEAAWSIHINGSNKLDVLKLLGAVGQCPVAGSRGAVQSVQDNVVTLNGIQYKGKSSDLCIVKKDEHVQPGDPLFAASSDPQDFPKIYTWKDTLPSILASLPVLTDFGVFTADNKDSQTVIGNVLPLHGDKYADYQTLCTQRNSDLTVPYVQLPASLNPAQYILSNVWKHSGFVIITPSSNQEDMTLAVNHILKRTVMGAMPTVFRYVSGTQTETIVPDKDTVDKLMLYYRDSVNNNTQWKERFNDFRP